jgi:hypothetical protein
LVELLTITVKNFFWFVDICRIVSTVMVNNSSNINTPKESLNSDGQQFLLYQQNKRKFLQWEELLAITVKTFFWFADIGKFFDHHCSNFLLVC